MLEEVPGPGEVPARDVVNRTIKMQRSATGCYGRRGTNEMGAVPHPHPRHQGACGSTVRSTGAMLSGCVGP